MLHVLLEPYATIQCLGNLRFIIFFTGVCINPIVLYYINYVRLSNYFLVCKDLILSNIMIECGSLVLRTFKPFTERIVHIA